MNFKRITKRSLEGLKHFWERYLFPLLQRGFRNRHIRRALSYAFTAIVAFFLYYKLFSNLFETPVDHELRISNRQLTEEYDQISESYRLIASTIQNIKERDENIFLQTFNIRPGAIEASHTVDRLQTKVELSSLSGPGLVRQLNKMARQTRQTASLARTTYDHLEARMLSTGKALSSIPAIQPIYNPDNSILVTLTGLRINPFYKTTELHKGVDYAVSEDTRVFASADGIVSGKESSKGTKGTTVTINHGNGYTSTYANLNKTTVNQGERVIRGEVIGYSGNTGFSFIPHLHYEISYRGSALDPTDFFFMEIDPYELKAFRQKAGANVQSMD